MPCEPFPGRWGRFPRFTFLKSSCNASGARTMLHAPPKSWHLHRRSSSAKAGVTLKFRGPIGSQSWNPSAIPLMKLDCTDGQSAMNRFSLKLTLSVVS